MPTNATTTTKRSPRRKPTAAKKVAAARRQSPRESMREQENWPSIDRAFVEFLERCWPPRSIMPGQSIEDAMFYAGKVALVEAIRNAYENQRMEGVQED